ncbi:hydrogenase expression/formation protein HypE [Stenomitos frigidus]|uniref:Hydrogenase expression/formation protein HypE n=1 Tax=Stenomitos frigidus ULC18 TaxID=2107698 RepID=A0A2T1EQ60_9CYAN|nr:hydrogenase expression/formation protein HypE [Stenomitos frigidus]PSB34887.1 hydrogenase expression/formation protein HypE [Stenomitos frigidus ULC18]
MKTNQNVRLSCPIPIQQYPHVLMAHGGGGKLMHQLIEQMFVPTFSNQTLNVRHDAAAIVIHGQNLAFTTDSYVVRPLFFPGGDIGSLAVNGTVNDLAMAGARPLYLSAGFILEEGLPMETLWQVVQSMQSAAQAANVQIVTGDTKVVDRGKGDGIFINTAGIGVIEYPQSIAPQSVQPGDVVLLNGDLGRHGMAIMAIREGLEFETTIASDSAPLAEVVLTLLEAGIELHCLRDLTRGGLASALNEIAEAAGVEIAIAEAQIPVHEEVQGACEILGFDPLYVANEGRFVAFVPEKDAKRALAIMRSHASVKATSDQPTNHPCAIGTVTGKAPGIVKMKSKIGAQRIVDMLSGEQLPRIC